MVTSIVNFLRTTNMWRESFRRSPGIFTRGWYFETEKDTFDWPSHFSTFRDESFSLPCVAFACPRLRERVDEQWRYLCERGSGSPRSRDSRDYHRRRCRCKRNDDQSRSDFRINSVIRERTLRVFGHASRVYTSAAHRWIDKSDHGTNKVRRDIRSNSMLSPFASLPFQGLETNTSFN